ncbi:MAG: S-layer homology domain-containing protein [Acidimicrobiaceae bacterium]|nr:S-layer homology domain-containing protein [Acidimicrobiaceae bacterium]
MLAAGALVASLLAVGASPAGAQAYSDRANNATRLSACVGDALGDQMFTDVSDMHTFKDAINCIAHYGVTNGTGDGSTYSPNQDVTRAEMAVFIARAAEAAGVDLGDAMSAGFTDIGDVWAEAQDAINRLASKGMISSGGAYRPDDAVTRAEMASFLIGLLVKASPTVSTSSAGALQLAGATPGSVTTASDWNYFGDARSTVPAANDAEISALYELGITKGASAAAVQDPTKAPLDVNYEPAGTVNRGEMAAFITRALAHTSVRPAGVTAQYDGSEVVISVRDENFAPMSNVLVDAFYTDTDAAGLAFRANGSCAEISALGNSQHDCEVDGADPLTGSDGDASETLSVARGGTTVWAWTGDTGDVVSSDTEPYRLDIPYEAALQKADRAKITTDNVDKAHMGTSVVYTLQLEKAGTGAVTFGENGLSPASYLATLTTHAYVGVGGTGDGDSDGYRDTPIIVTPVPLTTNADGKATITLSAPPDPAPGTQSDKFRVTLTIVQSHPAADSNAPAALVDGENAAIPATGIQVVFSTEPGVVTARLTDPTAATASSPDITVTVKPASAYAAAAGRGASNRATVTVTDQYGDPITGAKVTLTSGDGYNTNSTHTEPELSSLVDTTASPGDDDTKPRQFAVGRDGSYSFGYVFSSPGAVADVETLTGTLVGYDHDGDGCTVENIAITDTTNDEYRCADLDPDTTGAQPGTAPLTKSNTATVQWASDPVAADASATGLIVRAFDKDTNTVFVSGGAADAAIADLTDVRVLYYDSNDRFNVGEAVATATPSNYTGFERALAVGATLAWEFDSSVAGSRAVNEFTLATG